MRVDSKSRWDDTYLGKAENPKDDPPPARPPNTRPISLQPGPKSHSSRSIKAQDLWESRVSEKREGGGGTRTARAGRRRGEDAADRNYEARHQPQDAARWWHKAHIPCQILRRIASFIAGFNTIGAHLLVVFLFYFYWNFSGGVYIYNKGSNCI